MLFVLYSYLSISYIYSYLYLTYIYPSLLEDLAYYLFLSYNYKILATKFANDALIVAHTISKG